MTEKPSKPEILVAWPIAAVTAIAISAAPVYMDAPSTYDETAATAASVADAQRMAALQAAIDRACPADHPDPMQCALHVAQREQPSNWAPEAAQRAQAAATLLPTTYEHTKEQP